MTRVLVVHEDWDVADIEVDELRRAGYEVDQCAGPVGGSPCPVLNGRRCWQVDLADVLVYDVSASPDGRHNLFDALRDLHPDKPVVGQFPRTVLQGSAGPTLVGEVEAALREAASGGRARAIPQRDATRLHQAHYPRW